MKHSRSFLMAFLIHGMLAFLCLPSWAGYGPTVRTLQPYQVVSPEGTWRLEVKPGNREGAGPAATTLTNLKTGEIAWKRMLPYTFWQCCVNEKGIVGGYAYTKGAMGDNDPAKDAGQFLIRFLDVGAAPMHEETTHRTPSSIGMGYYLPAHYANRLLLDAGNDRMILLMPNGMFRAYSMRTGTLEGAFFPESKGEASGYGWPDEIRFIPGTRLMLLRSYSLGGNGTETTSISCIQLIDDQGRTLWAVSHRETFGADYNGPFPEFRILDPEPVAEEKGDADPFAEIDPFLETEETPEPSGPPAPRGIATFEVYLGDTGEEVAFRVLDTGDGNVSIYQVVEKGREKWKLPDEPEEDSPPVDFPAAAAKKLSGFRLTRADGTPLSEIAAVALGPEETIHALDSKSGHVHVFDRDGKFLHLCNSGKEHAIETNAYSASIAVDDKGEVFARISGSKPAVAGGADVSDPLAGHYLRFSPEGVLKQETLSQPSSELSGDLVAQPKVSNLIFYGYGDEVAVNRRDEYGSREATLAKRADGQWLELIRDVACARDGTIAVRDTSMGDSSGGFVTPFPRLPNHLPSETITIYEPGGDPICTIDFSRFASLSEIAFDGKYIAATYPYDPSTPLVYLFTAAGEPVGAIRIKELEKQERVDLRPFITGDGKEILAVDLSSGMAFRFVMP